MSKGPSSFEVANQMKQHEGGETNVQSSQSHGTSHQGPMPVPGASIGMPFVGEMPTIGSGSMDNLTAIPPALGDVMETAAKVAAQFSGGDIKFSETEFNKGSEGLKAPLNTHATAVKVANPHGDGGQSM